jgi:hypothetical protein
MQATDTLEVSWDVVREEAHRFVLVLARAVPDRPTRDRLAAAYQPGVTYARLVTDAVRGGLLGPGLPPVVTEVARGLLEGPPAVDGGAAAGSVEAQVRAHLLSIPLFRRLASRDGEP